RERAERSHADEGLLNGLLLRTPGPKVAWWMLSTDGGDHAEVSRRHHRRHLLDRLARGDRPVRVDLLSDTGAHGLNSTAGRRSAEQQRTGGRGWPAAMVREAYASRSSARR